VWYSSVFDHSHCPPWVIFISFWPCRTPHKRGALHRRHEYNPTEGHLSENDVQVYSRVHWNQRKDFLRIYWAVNQAWIKPKLIWRIIESLRLEKISKIIKSNQQPNTTMPTQPYPEVPHLHVFWIPPGMGTQPPPWAACPNAWPLFQ